MTKTNTNLDQFKYFFTNRIVNAWNGLPSGVVHAESVNSFKNAIDKIFRDHLYSLEIQI